MTTPRQWTRSSIEGLFRSGDHDAIDSFLQAVNEREGLLADIEFLGTAQQESAIAGDKLQQQADALRAGISNALQIVVYSDSKTVPQVISEMVDILQAALAQAGGGK